MECAFCPKDDHDTWLGAYTVGEYHVCTTCYHRYIAEGEPPSDTSEDAESTELTAEVSLGPLEVEHDAESGKIIARAPVEMDVPSPEGDG